jgi:hypothetical protein
MQGCLFHIDLITSISVRAALRREEKEKGEGEGRRRRREEKEKGGE